MVQRKEAEPLEPEEIDRFCRALRPRPLQDFNPTSPILQFEAVI